MSGKIQNRAKTYLTAQLASLSTACTKQFVFSIARMLDLNKDSKDSKESKQPQSKGKRAAGKKIELEVVLEDLEHTLISWPTAWLVRNAVIKKKVLLASSLKPLSSSSSSSGASSSSKSRA